MRIVSLSPALLLGVFIAACTTYQNLADPANELQPSPSPVAQARVTLRDGERFDLDAPCVEGDSLTGMSAEGLPRHVALTEVSRVQVPKRGAGRTPAFVDAMVLANSDMWIRRQPSSGCPQGGE